MLDARDAVLVSVSRRDKLIVGKCKRYRGYRSGGKEELCLPILCYQTCCQAVAGKALRKCPIATADGKLVTLPYNLLLQKNAREALDIDLTNQIVVIDEAHSMSFFSHCAETRFDRYPPINLLYKPDLNPSRKCPVSTRTIPSPIPEPPKTNSRPQDQTNACSSERVDEGVREVHVGSEIS